MIKTNTKELLKVLSDLIKVVPERPAVPSLTSFLLESADGLRITASDLEVALTESVAAEGALPQPVCIPARTLLGLVRTLPNGEVTIDRTDTSAIVRWEGGESEMPAFGAEDFSVPQEPSGDMDTACIDSPTLAAELKKLLPAVSSDTTRPVMTGMYFDFEDEALNIVASDARVLFTSRIEGVLSTTAGDRETVSPFVLPKKAAALLAGMLSGHVAGMVKVSHDGEHAVFEDSGFSLRARLTSGKYPNYRAVMPADSGNTARIHRERLINIIQRAMTCESGVTVRLEFTSGRLCVTAENLLSSTRTRETMDAEYDGQGIVIGFKGTLLAEALSSVCSGKAQIVMKSGRHAALVAPSPEGEEKPEPFKGVVMPISLSDSN